MLHAKSVTDTNVENMKIARGHTILTSGNFPTTSVPCTAPMYKARLYGRKGAYIELYRYGRYGRYDEFTRCAAMNDHDGW